MNAPSPIFDHLPKQSASREGSSPADTWSKQAAQHALDDLLQATRSYRSSSKYLELLKFVRRFRFYSPYNALLVHIQRPGAHFVAPARRWNRHYRRYVQPNASPIVILQPMGPVMFVYDVSETEGGPQSKPLPPEVVDPFAVRYGKIGGEFERTIENAKRDGIRIRKQKAGSQAAGSIRPVDNQHCEPLRFSLGKDRHGNPIDVPIAVRYDLLLNEDHPRESLYATLVHELAHLYCGHMGSPDETWWPDRRGLSKESREFEAESVSYLVCGRVGVKSPSEQYLAGFVNDKDEVPQMSLECVMKSVGLIETMGSRRLKLRKE